VVAMPNEKFDEYTAEFQALARRLKETTDLIERKHLLMKMKSIIDEIDRLTPGQKNQRESSMFLGERSPA
jgi:hypothetical protein